ncbi:MAG: DUF434 domain-containing protein [Planctomycetia bacterium]|nr:DUF434 domain-containing protein [Planctomycetia bacterium]
MPDRRVHRGPHPSDGRIFGAEALPALRAAAHDLSWLLGRDYAEASSLKIVGDRYDLVARQRTALTRAVCSEQQRDRRRAHEVPLSTLRGQTVLVDGYNVLTTIEAALSGGAILACRDGAWRDMASMHGSYRKVAETRPALALVGGLLAEHEIGSHWYLDSPVSNSGRLRTFMLDVSAATGWDWQIELVANPDAILRKAGEPVASADSAILDACERWVNLARSVVTAHVAEAWIVDLESMKNAERQ